MVDLGHTLIVALSALTQNQYMDLTQKYKGRLFDKFSKCISSVTHPRVVEKPVSLSQIKHLIDSLP